MSVEDKMSYRFVCACYALFVSCLIHAEELETITVSATPIKVDDSGSSINVISKQDILDRNVNSLQSLFREIPGFAISQQGSSGAISQLRVRGAEANQMLVLINGIEVNDPAQGSEFDFSQITVSDIERVEIVRGPQSALWGSDAMAGVVHIITTPIEASSGFEGSVQMGSFSTRQATLSGNYKTLKNRAKFTADYLETDGTNISRTGSENDGLDNLTLGLSGRFDASDNLSFEYTARHTDKTSEYDATDFFVTGLPTDADYRTHSEYLYTGISLKHTINDKFDHRLGLQRTDTDNQTQNDNPIDSITRATRDALRYQVNYYNAANRLSLLVERETEKYEQRGPVSFFGDPNRNEDQNTNSVAAEYRYDGTRLHVSASTRRDHNNEFKNADSWRITSAFKLDEITLYGSLGESVKNPTFTERFGFFTNFIGNPDLNPETSYQWEIGVRSSLMDESLDLAATYFNANLKDEINGFVYNFATGGFTSANIEGESDRSGFELEMEYKSGGPWDLRATYTYLDANQQSAAGKVSEVRRPEHSGSLAFNYRWSHSGINLVISHTGKQTDDFFPPFPPFQERVVLDAFTLVSASGYYEFSDNVTLMARLENVSDESYEQVFGYSSPGIGATIGVRILR